MHKFLIKYLSRKKKFNICNNKAVVNSSFPGYNTVQKEMFGKRYTMYKDNYARIKEKCILELLRQQKYQMELREGAQDFLFYILVNRFGLLPLPVATYITRTVSNKERVDIINLSCMSDSQDIFLDLLQTLPGFDTSEEGKN